MHLLQNDRCIGEEPRADQQSGTHTAFKGKCKVLVKYSILQTFEFRGLPLTLTNSGLNLTPITTFWYEGLHRVIYRWPWRRSPDENIQGVPGSVLGHLLFSLRQISENSRISPNVRIQYVHRMVSHYDMTDVYVIELCICIWRHWRPTCATKYDRDPQIYIFYTVIVAF